LALFWTIMYMTAQAVLQVRTVHTTACCRGQNRARLGTCAYSRLLRAQVALVLSMAYCILPCR
jgi:hypothetical protein